MGVTGARRLTGTVVAAVLAMAFGGVTRAQATDPTVGTWKLDVAKSTYKPGPTPKSVTFVVEPAGQGIKVAVDTIMADGTAVKWGYTSARDGKDVPITGNPNYDTANVTQTSPTNGTIVYSKGGKVVGSAKTAVGKDGKTMTVTITGTDPKGQAIHNVAVFTKS